MLAAIFLFVVAQAAAQEPKPCEAPAKFEARMYKTDFRKNFTEAARIHYDETNQRVREVAEYHLGSDREAYDVLSLHNESKQYILNMRTRKCEVKELKTPFVPFGVPTHAKYRNSFTVGPNIANEHISIVEFEGLVEGSTYRGTATVPDCIPVNIDISNILTGYVHRSFYDVTIGILDTNAFTPP